MAISQFVPFISLLTIVAIPLIKLSDSAGTMFDLIHRDRLPGFQHLTQAERIKQTLHRDMIRMQRIQNNNQQHVIKRQTLEAAVTPIASGYDYGTGEYFVELMVGTPAQTFLLVVDTLTDFTWVDCIYSRSKHKPYEFIIFDADKSTSFRTIKCSSTTCKKDLSILYSQSQCPHLKDNCRYSYPYGVKTGYGGDDLAVANGIFAYETIRFNLTDGKTSATNNTLIGCTGYRPGLHSILGNGGSGIMGLSNTQFSLPNQASHLFGPAFSYCLVDFHSPKNKSSKLFFGSPSKHVMPKIDGPMQRTKLEVKPFYGVNVQSISIGGSNFAVDKDEGTIIDSGSALTYLLDSVYTPVIKALAKLLRMFKRVGRPEGIPLQLCYKTNGFNDSAVPYLEIRFVDGARLRVPGKSYLLDVGGGVTCVALVNTTSGYNLIGNMLQQNKLWVFDIKNGRLSFGSSSCTK